MGTIAEKLELLSHTKSAIREAIVEKGQIVGEGDPFSTYPANIRAISAGNDAVSTPLDPMEVYKATRPSDWLPMPEPADNEIYMLFHIPDGASSLLAFKAVCSTESYTVSLGSIHNGAFVASQTANVGSGEVYEAELDSGDYGDLTGNGMKQAMIKVSGTDIQSFELSEHSKKQVQLYWDWNIVEISGRLPFADNLYFDGLRRLRFFALWGENQVTMSISMFEGDVGLQAVLALDMSKADITARMFAGCASLIAIPKLDTSNLTSMQYMFSGCRSLSAIWPMDTSKVSDMIGTFQYCKSLIVAPAMDTGAVSAMSDAYEECSALVAVHDLRLAKSSVISGWSFDDCSSLQSLTVVPDEKMSYATYLDLTNCSLGHKALVALFESLPEAYAENRSESTLYITGNPGVSELTEAEKAVATDKGWVLNLS